MNISNFVGKVVQAVSATKLIDPNALVNLGVRDIHTYRTDIATTIKDNLSDPKDQVVLFQLMMAQGNKKRLLSALKQEPELAKNNPKVITFIEKNTCATTKDHKMGMVCTLKIAPSFPEICAAIFVVTMAKIKEQDIGDKLVRQLWASSLNFTEEVQEINRNTTMVEWNRWGKQNPAKKNALGEQIKFDEKIYENAAKDDIKLILLSGKEFEPGKKYDIVSVNRYVQLVTKELRVSAVSSVVTNTPQGSEPASRSGVNEQGQAVGSQAVAGQVAVDGVDVGVGAEETKDEELEDVVDWVQQPVDLVDDPAVADDAVTDAVPVGEEFVQEGEVPADGGVEGEREQEEEDYQEYLMERQRERSEMVAYLRKNFDDMGFVEAMVELNKLQEDVSEVGALSAIEDYREQRAYSYARSAPSTPAKM